MTIPKIKIPVLIPLLVEELTFRMDRNLNGPNNASGFIHTNLTLCLVYSAENSESNRIGLRRIAESGVWMEEWRYGEVTVRFVPHVENPQSLILRSALLLLD